MNSTHWWLALIIISAARLFGNTTLDSGTREIIGGNETKSDEFKYALGINCNYLRCRCTGSIINELYIVSAAHCFINEKLKFTFGSIRIVAGTNDISKYKDPRRVEMSVKKLYVPAGFNYTYTDDIAVFKLRHSLELKKNNLEKLRLPAKARSNNKYTDKNAVLLGFGVSKLTYTVFRNGTVEEFNYPNPHLHCSGDSGSPLVYKSKVLIGVYIRGPLTCNERFDFGVYTKVKSYLDFNEIAMKDNTTGMIFRNY